MDFRHNPYVALGVGILGLSGIGYVVYGLNKSNNTTPQYSRKSSIGESVPNGIFGGKTRKKKNSKQ